mmetsp:Transcript_26257/g.52727  ORF Transcript_26257/g.52727 Transcript_26257/m.52727 type:complete len:290 (-) Transcript_26257:169-1038(-)
MYCTKPETALSSIPGLITASLNKLARKQLSILAFNSACSGPSIGTTSRNRASLVKKCRQDAFCVSSGSYSMAPSTLPNSASSASSTSSSLPSLSSTMALTACATNLRFSPSSRSSQSPNNPTKLFKYAHCLSSSIPAQASRCMGAHPTSWSRKLSRLARRHSGSSRSSGAKWCRSKPPAPPPGYAWGPIAPSSSSSSSSSANGGENSFRGGGAGGCDPSLGGGGRGANSSSSSSSANDVNAYSEAHKWEEMKRSMSKGAADNEARFAELQGSRDGFGTIAKFFGEGMIR